MAVENFFLKFLFSKSQRCSLFLEDPMCFLFSCEGCTNLSLFFLHLYILTTDPDSHLWLHTLFLTTERPSIGMLYKMLLYVPRFYFPYIWYNMLLYLCCTFLFSLLTLESGINIRVRLLIFEGFSRGYVLLKWATFINFWFL